MQQYEGASFHGRPPDQRTSSLGQHSRGSQWSIMSNGRLDRASSVFSFGGGLRYKDRYRRVLWVSSLLRGGWGRTSKGGPRFLTCSIFLQDCYRIKYILRRHSTQ